MKKLLLSYRALSSLFNRCDGDFIHNVCKGYCCTFVEKSFPVGLLPEEREFYSETYGIDCTGDVLRYNEDKTKCPFYDPSSSICQLYDVDGVDKRPFECKISPFVITSKGKVTVYYTWYARKCYRAKYKEKVPAYVAYKGSLTKILGSEEAYNDAVKRLEETKDNVLVEIPDEVWDKIVYTAQKRSEYYGKMDPVKINSYEEE